MQTLLEIKPGFDPRTLVPDYKPGWLFDDLKMRLLGVILRWQNELSQTLSQAITQSEHIPSLKAWALKVLQADSLGILTEGLLAKKLLTDIHKAAIDTLQITLFTSLELKETPFLAIPLMYSLRKKDEQTTSINESLSAKFSAFRALTRHYNENHNSKLEAILKELNLSEQILFLRALPLEELFPILKLLYSFWSPDQLIEYIYCENVKRLEEIVLNLDVGLISGLRITLLEATKEKKEMFQFKCEKLIFELARAHNEEIKAEIGALASTLRSIELHNISSEMLDQIRELSEKVNTHQRVFENLERLMRPFKWNKLVRATFIHLGEGYHRSIMRVSKVDVSLPEALYHILYDKSFNKFKDDESASIMMFSEWNFYDKSELSQFGLTEDWSKAKTELETRGLVTVADLKHHDIYNKELLRKFLVPKAAQAAKGD